MTLNSVFTWALIVITLGVPLVVGFAIVGLWRRARSARGTTRADTLRAWAHDNGLSFDPTRDLHAPALLPHHPFFSDGRDRACRNTMTTTVDHAGRTFTLRFGDHDRTTGIGRSTTLRRASYLLIETPFVRMPHSSIAYRPSSLIAGADIDFEDAEFSRRFHVESADKRFAYDLLHPRMIELLKHNTPPGMSIEVSGPSLLFTDESISNAARDQPPAFIQSAVGEPLVEDTRWSTRTFGNRLALALSLVELFPEHLARSLAP